MMQELPKNYDPAPAEARWYAHWMQQGFFNADPETGPGARPAYTIVIPPPNVTGILHMGHMLNNTIQDVLIRRKRMQGYNACWVPGTDHASIATEAKVVQLLRTQGIKKGDLTREKFLEHAWEWKEKYGGIILEQLKKLGASCDWRRTRFTMDPDMSEAVAEVFIRLYDRGLIYRGLRMVNWDPAGLTALSDEEVIYKEGEARLYHVQYPVHELPGQHITIATTRPETILADVAVAVHPDDPRYTHLHGKHVVLPVIGRIIPIITDAAVDLEFGTGCLKVTPAHDQTDYEIGLRHGLPVISCLNADGTLNEHGGPYQGMDRFDCRTQIAKDLEAAGSLVKTETITNKVGHSERTDAVIEPRLSEQWFVRMKDLAGPALAMVNDGHVNLIPDRYLNTYRHWLENVKDWCISRQLWWGQRVPAWYAPDGQIFVGKDLEQAFHRAQAAGYTGSPENLKQDEDVVDTWFSSWLWPITVFGGMKDPENPDYKYFYPTDDLVTAPEILFFWVARMIMAGNEFSDRGTPQDTSYAAKRPFKHVYLTGIVRDKLRRKMSKQLGNSPDPLDLMAKYGADGVRAGLLLASAAGNDLMFDESLCEQGRNFSNKIWNAWRLVHGWQERLGTPDAQGAACEALATNWMAARLAQASAEVEELFQQFRLSETLNVIYRLIWDDFCSLYLELAKPAYGGQMSQACYSSTLGFFEDLMKLLHPFMPFLTEEVWHSLRQRTDGDCIIVAQLAPAAPTDAQRALVAAMDLSREVVTALRTLRTEKQIAPKVPIRLLVDTPDRAFFTQYQPLIAKFVNTEALEFVAEAPAGAASLIIRDHKLYVPMEGHVDLAAERAKLEEELAYTRGFLENVMKKLGNEKFMANAKEEVKAGELKKKADAEARIQALEAALA